MDELTSGQFTEFFRELHGYLPFPWQTRLAGTVCDGGWPKSLDLPTASGKTACIDIAVFSMAVLGRGPRRIFFVVDRRVVVDAAYERMQEIARRIAGATNGVLSAVRSRLCQMGRGNEPLSTYQLRGGIYRDDSWVRSPLQPALIASTVDQVGSRLLFRGYGVSDKVWPVHAALVANDALILLDEAHCSRAFSETVCSLERYRGNGWAARDLSAPFEFVEMTATPIREMGEPFRLTNEDYEHPVLQRRLYAPKRARLVVSKARLKDLERFAKDLTEQAFELAQKPGLRRIAVMVNRVKTARLVYALLQENGKRAHLLLGRMRPVDRSVLPADLIEMLSGNLRETDREPVFIVATQCLEVGADLDFDAVVTECASIDALLQRFGRLDRIGDLCEAGIVPEGRVVVSTPMADSKYWDPVYRNALATTWAWLRQGGDQVDFGLCSRGGDETIRERLQKEPPADRGLWRETPPIPVLLPAHLDALVQTSPPPAVEPDIHLFLHGEENGSPEVQVVWRADLDPEGTEAWAEVVAVCPPVSSEAMSVPLRDFRTWLLSQGALSASSSDIEGADEGLEIDEVNGDAAHRVLVWRGDDSEIVQGEEGARKIRPGDTLVVPASSGGWNQLGHIPPGAVIDGAEQARLQLRRSWLLRLHPEVLTPWPDNEGKAELLRLAKSVETDRNELVGALRDYAALLDENAPGWLRDMLFRVPNRPRVDAYPASKGSHIGWVLSTNHAEADSGGDEASAATPVFLDVHLSDVKAEVAELATLVIESEEVRNSLVQAARMHDAGKADIRFQALLHGGDSTVARFYPKLLAKGETARQSPAVRRAQRVRSGLPEGFRHELVSLLLGQQDPEIEGDELALHLIASHHGRCRPFAPVVVDDGGDLTFKGLRLRAEQRVQLAPHKIESGVADRYWRLTRCYGWWGLAYLEALLRLGDWKASKEETEREAERG